MDSLRWLTSHPLQCLGVMVMVYIVLLALFEFAILLLKGANRIKDKRR